MIMGQSLKIFSSRLHIRWWIACLMMVLLTSIVPLAYAQSRPRVPEQVESLTQPVRAGDNASPLKPRRVGASPAPVSISIGPVLQQKRAAEMATVSRPGTPHKIGFGRDVPKLGSAADTAAHLQWRSTPQAGNIAAISISSPQAFGIRLGILVRRLPVEATLRFYVQGAEAAYEISGSEVMESIRRNLDAGDSGDEALTYWSPHIDGEEATLEIELPSGISPDAVEISIPGISHFFSPPLAAPGGGAVMSIGDAASCEIDATCYSAWSPEGNATAKMSFVENRNSYVCSGTLLNDMAASGIPYFLSANHCISKQTVASTLQTYWFYRSSSCNSGTLNPGNKTLTGGATLLYASSVTDTSFMRLNSTPPAGAVYAAWDTTAPALGTLVTALHHPSGDLQKISSGSIQSFEDCAVPDPISDTFTCNASTQASAEYLNIAFTSGITESGSSGSGLFKTSGGTHYLIGQLYGGDTSCSNPNGSNDYGRFDVSYTAVLYQWLSAGSTFSLSVSKPGNGSGTVVSVPSGINCGTACSAPFARGTSVTLTATPAAGSTFAGWSGACSGAGTSCSFVMNAASSVTATFSIVTISLGVALDNTSLVWTTGGNAPFAAQTTTSYSGGSAAQTGRIGNNQNSYLATSVTGPGMLSFYWKVSSERNYDIFSVYQDGVLRYSWSGNTAWYKSELTIPAGTHTIKWEYVKDDLYSSGQDAGWIDSVVFTPSITCTYTLPSTSIFYTAQEAIGAVTINATSGCGWTASSNASWITITTAGRSGTGNGYVLFSVAANTGAAQRIGTITVADQAFTITQAGVPTYLDYVDTVQKIYIGYYERPADPAGLIYWAEKLNESGGDLDKIIEAFAASDESVALHGVITGGNISTVVNDTYLALFARPADTGGLNYYLDGFTAGRFTAATIMLNILDGATGGNDLLSVNNKLNAANLFTRTIDPGFDGRDLQATYAYDADAAKARQFLAAVTWSSATVPTQSQTTAYIRANISDPGDVLTPTVP
jgi:lysyl endopeptidase